MCTLTYTQSNQTSNCKLYSTTQRRWIYIRHTIHFAIKLTRVSCNTHSKIHCSKNIKKTIRKAGQCELLFFMWWLGFVCAAVKPQAAIALWDLALIKVSLELSCMYKWLREWNETFVPSLCLASLLAREQCGICRSCCTFGRYIFTPVSIETRFLTRPHPHSIFHPSSGAPCHGPTSKCYRKKWKGANIWQININPAEPFKQLPVAMQLYAPAADKIAGG